MPTITGALSTPAILSGSVQACASLVVFVLFVAFGTFLADTRCKHIALHKAELACQPMANPLWPAHPMLTTPPGTHRSKSEKRRSHGMTDVTTIDIAAELAQDSITMNGGFICTPPGR
jgi:hypothetical protein